MSNSKIQFFMRADGEYFFTDQDVTELPRHKGICKGQKVKLRRPPVGFDARFTDCVAEVQLILKNVNGRTPVYFFLAVPALEKDVQAANIEKRRDPTHEAHNRHDNDLIKVSSGAMTRLGSILHLLDASLVLEAGALEPPAEEQAPPVSVFVPVPAPAPAPVHKFVPASAPAPSVSAIPDIGTKRERDKIAQANRRFNLMQNPEPKRQRTQPSQDTDPLSYVGRRVRKAFRKEMYMGTVTSVSTAGEGFAYEFRPGVQTTRMFSVVYDDDDTEDLSWSALKKILV